MVKLTRWDPFQELEDLHRAVFGDRPLAGLIRAMNVPTADVYTDEKKLTAEVHLPNFNEDEIDVSISNNALEIRAEHSEKVEEKKKKERKYVVKESSSSFYRAIALPKHADEDKIKAEFEKGVLKVEVPFKKLPEPKKVAIKAKK